jgi:hypothetical protein
MMMKPCPMKRSKKNWDTLARLTLSILILPSSAPFRVRLKEFSNHLPLLIADCSQVLQMKNPGVYQAFTGSLSGEQQTLVGEIMKQAEAKEAEVGPVQI